MAGPRTGNSHSAGVALHLLFLPGLASPSNAALGDTLPRPLLLVAGIVEGATRRLATDVSAPEKPGFRIPARHPCSGTAVPRRSGRRAGPARARDPGGVAVPRLAAVSPDGLARRSAVLLLMPLTWGVAHWHRAGLPVPTNRFASAGREVVAWAILFLPCRWRAGRGEPANSGSNGCRSRGRWWDGTVRRFHTYNPSNNWAIGSRRLQRTFDTTAGSD